MGYPALSDASDAQLREIVSTLPVVPLLPALAAAEQNPELTPPDLRPDPDNAFDDNGGLTPAQIERARDIAFEVLRGWRAAAPQPVDDPALFRQLFEYLVGDRYVDQYHELMLEEMAPAGDDLKAPAWTVRDYRPEPFRVAVIGCGMSGIAAAHRLGQAGFDVTVFEKNPDVGGTWFENTYPGCRVDVPNHLYSYSFAQTDEWPHHFSPQEVLLDYFRECATRFGVREKTRFNTEVVRAVFDDETVRWRLDTSSNGDHETQWFDAVVSAVGQLNRPNWPSIKGRDQFSGSSFHSARWDRSVELAGKRVGIIGTGASAMQFIPHVAEQAAQLTIFQRTPPWLVPTPDYWDEVPDALRWAFTNIPGFSEWYRIWQFWRMHEGLVSASQVDPEWDGMPASVSAPNELVRQLLTGYIEAEFGDRPDLLEKVLPTYPPVSKRIVRDNGVWAKTLKADHVALETGQIEQITPDGVITADGVEHPCDVIIYGTGFTASEFLTPMQVIGRRGIDLHDAWDGEARAYLGVTIPGFPNFFCLYGPNTNLVINGSIIYFTECEVHLSLELLRHALARGCAAVEVKQDVHDRYNVEIDAANAQMAWGASDVPSWYKSASGRVSQNWPYSLHEFWRRTRSVDPADYETLGCE